MDKASNQIAAIQMTSGMDVAQNLAQAGQLLEQAAQRGALLAVLPEMFPLLGQGRSFKQARMEIQETLGHGPIQDFLASTAKRLGLWIIAGTIPIKSVDPMRSYAACLVFNAQGEMIAHYNKLHLFDAVLSKTEAYQESENTMPGEDIVVVQTPVGKVGLSICYDIRFPELYRALLKKGAEIFALPAAFTVTTGRMHWDVLTRALAIHHFCYVVAAGQYGVHGMERETYGHSMIISPNGQVLAQLPHGTGVITAEIDLEKLAQCRKQIPALLHQRI
jgi:nitrilase